MTVKLSERRTQVYFPETLHRRLKAYAREQGLSAAEVIRRAVIHYLEGEVPQEDPLFQIVGAARGLGVRDASSHHDRYLYGYSLKPQSKGQKKPNHGHRQGQIPD
ncbi:MAG: CopG family transcriptional regulator [Anaerolineae bacterium]